MSQIDQQVYPAASGRPARDGGNGSDRNESDRSNSEEGVTFGGGYGTSAPSDYSREFGVDFGSYENPDFIPNSQDPDLVVGVGADADAHFDERKVELGAGAEAGADYSVSELINLNASVGASAGFRGGDGRLEAGADASVGVEASLGTSGNEVAVGVGYGVGAGVGLVLGEDSDGDGQREYGGSVNVKIGGGGEVGVRFELEAVLNRAREFLGISTEENPTFVRENPTFVRQMSNPEQSLGMRRLDEAFARLQSLC